MDTINLTSDNYNMYAIHFYSGPNFASEDEFLRDLAHIGYLKKLLARFDRGDAINFRLIVNHMTLLSNLYNPYSLSKLLFFKIERPMWGYVTTILKMMNLLPPVIQSVNGVTIKTSDFQDDPVLLENIQKVIY